MGLIKFTAKQEVAMDALSSGKYVFILFGGAMGGGKTFWGLSSLLVMCEIFPNSRWCVIREDLEKIRTTTIPSFKKLNASGRLRELPYEYTHPNGSVILFKGENWDKDKDLQWLKGLEVNGFLFEEINECQEDTLDLAFGRAGRWECNPRPKPIILATCNPTQNWVKKRIYDKWEKNELPDKWLYIPSKVTDNEYLTPEYLENLKNMPRFKYMVFVEGNWNVQLKTGGEFYKCFELEKHVQTMPYNPELPIHMSWDDNVNPYLPVGIFQVHQVVENRETVGYNIYMIDEIAGEHPNNTVKAVCNEFKRRYPNHRAGLFVYGDATASKEDTKLEKGMNFYKIIFEQLSVYQPKSRITRSNPSVVMRGNWFNTVLELNRGGLSFYVAEHCAKTISDFVNLKEAADGTKNKEMDTDPKTKVRYQKYGHFTDLTDYFMCSCFYSEYQSYQKGGHGTMASVGRNTSRNTY